MRWKLSCGVVICAPEDAGQENCRWMARGCNRGFQASVGLHPEHAEPRSFQLWCLRSPWVQKMPLETGLGGSRPDRPA